MVLIPIIFIWRLLRMDCYIGICLIKNNLLRDIEMTSFSSLSHILSMSSINTNTDINTD
jgi:hypothetical protein